ncbi:MAG: isochorismatase family protein [Erysipelotrichia bacterium]|nr:isochorismatase family protein [Erysipelotrichia bacterium]
MARRVGLAQALINDPEYDAVYATMDTHESDYLNTFEGKHLPVAHCIRGSEGWKIQSQVSEALTKRNAIIFRKSTFGAEHLAEAIREANPDMITLCGLDTDICVLSNAIILRSFLPNTVIEVVASACAATTELKQKETLDVLESCQIAVRKD